MWPGGSGKEEGLWPNHEVPAHSFEFLLPWWFPASTSVWMLWTQSCYFPAGWWSFLWTRACFCLVGVANTSDWHFLTWNPWLKVLTSTPFNLSPLPSSPPPHPHLSNSSWIFFLEVSVSYLKCLYSSRGHVWTTGELQHCTGTRMFRQAKLVPRGWFSFAAAALFWFMCVGLLWDGFFSETLILYWPQAPSVFLTLTSTYLTYVPALKIWFI